jgi:tetratricopeptide (TPR) repeat protein
MACPPVADAQGAAIVGTLRNAEGTAVSGARVTIKAESPMAPSESTASASTGEFQFQKLSIGTFTLSVQARGYAVATRQIEIATQNFLVRVDFELTHDSAALETKPTRPNSTARPSFQAAGVRGLIDAGGYSAAANGAAASGLIEGMADIRRADTEIGSIASKPPPCEVGPQLRATVSRDPDSADANRKLGEFYLAYSQPERAIPFLESAFHRNSSDIASAKDLALAWIQTGKFQDARDLLSGISTVEDAEIRTLLARTEEGLGMFEEAAKQYRAAGQLAPSAESSFGVGYELILAGRPADAEQAFRGGLDRFPNSLRLLIGAGASDFLLGNHAVGIEQFLRAAEVAPADPRPYRFLVSTVVTSGDKSAAIRGAFQRYLQIDPDNPDANYDYAFSLWSARTQETDAPQLQGIEALFKRAIELRPDFAQAHLQLGNLYFERQDYKLAAPEYEAALRGDPGSNEIHYRLARVYHHTGQTDLADQQLRAFEAARDSNSAAGGGGVMTIEKFISVISSGPRRGNSNLSCDTAGAP